jgi:hypothetical protein
MKNILKKMCTLLTVSLFCLQFAGAVVTTVNTYSLTGQVIQAVEQGSDGVQGNTTTYDAYGRVATVTSIQNAVTNVATYSYNAVSELAQVSSVGTDGATYTTTISQHGAESVTMVRSPVTNGQDVMSSLTRTAANGNAVTYTYNSDVKNGTNRVVAVTFSTKWGNSTTYHEGEKIGNQSWADYIHSAGLVDPLVAGTVQSISMINGQAYAAVKADTIDMYDGKGAQAADGETIYVAIDATTYANLDNQMKSSNGQSVSICISGNVASDVNGHMSMTMNAGGYSSAIGQSSAEVATTWKAANQTFYNSMLAKMAPVWADAAAQGMNNDWQLGWAFLKTLM